MEREYLGDAGVVKTSQHFSLTLEPLQEIRMTKAFAQYFDGHRSPGAILLSRVHDAHAAGTDCMQHEEAAEHRARPQRPIGNAHVERGYARRIEEAVFRSVQRFEHSSISARRVGLPPQRRCRSSLRS